MVFLIYFLFIILLITIYSIVDGKKIKNVYKKLNIENESNENIEIKIYYEPLCTDSISFFNYSLKEFYNNRKELIEQGLVENIQFIPGGLSKHKEENDKVTFKCLHGYKGCQANKMHACANQLLKKDVYNEYIFCYFDLIDNNEMNKDNYAVTKKCATDKFDFSLIEKCLKPDGKGIIQADNYLLDILTKKEKLPEKVKNVPWVLFNNQFNKLREKYVERSIMSYLCQNYKIVKSLNTCKKYQDI